MLYRAITLLCLFASLALTAPLRATTVTDPDLAYSITIPDGWVQIPNTNVDAVRQRVLNQHSPFNFTCCVAYQPAANLKIKVTQFEYPFLLIGYVPYAEDAPHDQIAEDDLRHLMIGPAGLTSDSAHSRLRSDADEPKKDDDSDFDGAYFTSPPGFRIETSITIPQAGLTHCAAVGRLGKHQTDMICFFGKATDWPKSKPLFDQLAASFTLAPEEQATLAPDPFQWPALSNVALVIFIAAIIGGGMLLWKRMRQSTARSRGASPA